MKRFPVNFKISNRYSEFQLNDEWTVECLLLLDEQYERSYEKNLNLRCSIKTSSDITYEEVLISGELSFKKLHGTVLKTSEFSKYMQRSHPSMRFVELICPKESFRSPVLEDLYLCGLVIIISSDDYCVQPKSLMQLSNDLEQLLCPETSCFADVNLICGEDSIPAHKAILSVRSSVFAAMFKNPMKETEENKVFITDIDVSVLRILMMYIYTGELSALTSTSATDLLVAADKYMIQDLKEDCCEFLENNLTLQHVLTILVSGGDSLPECLKSVVMDYISDESADFSSIENVEEWNTLKEKNPALAMEVMESFVKSRDKK